MKIELFVHIAHLEDLFNGRPVNCKINYASQYDMRILINPKKYILVQSDKSNSNLITIRKRTFRDILRHKKKFK